MTAARAVLQVIALKHYHYRRVSSALLQHQNTLKSKLLTGSFDSARTKFSTTTKLPSFFTFNSGRARRKRKSRLLLSQRHDENEGSSDTVDKRTVMDILFPNPFKGMDLPNQTKWPTTISRWKEVFSLAWREYKETWVGFTTSKGIFVEENDVIEEQARKKQVEVIKSKSQEVMKNVKRNARFLQVGALKIRKEVRERTGITSIEDVKALAADAMRLATECLTQFMQGYRKGRDEEVEKMLTQYFQNLEAEANTPKKKRRKPKRRIVNRYHPMNRNANC
jgi:hypothetical protein